MEKRRSTQKDIATMAGVHTSTVCLALKNHPTIPESTRQRIQQIAFDLGYQPDPMLSALAAYRTTLRPAAFHGQLAWLSLSNARFNWRRISVYNTYMQGAAKQAERYGYTLQDYNLGERGMTPKRLAGIMRARGVRGILVCPMPDAHMELDFPWEGFAAVAIGHTLERPAINLVAAKPLVIDSKQIKAGETVAVVETDHDLERVLNGTRIGSVVTKEAFEQLPKVDASAGGQPGTGK